jgi:plastocyanin
MFRKSTSILLALVPVLILLTGLSTVPMSYAQNATSQNATSQNATSQNATEPAVIPIPVPVPVPLLISDILFIPPPGYEEVREIPSYAIRIPFSNDGRSSFEPATVAIPATMTVIWFNDDQNPHTVTMNASSSNVSSANATFDSGFIPPSGQFIHQFLQEGIYEYYDSTNPSAKGRINVGYAYELGTNIDMLVGGDVLPFNASQLERLTLSFVPHENVTTLPPPEDITYNVTIANSTGSLYSNQFVDADGILDLELVPISNTERFVDWGPDTGDITGKPSDGTFHVQGPVLVDEDVYQIEVSIIEKEGSILSTPITDTFVVPSAGSQ